MVCCVVVGGAAFYLTTRLGIGRVDFRGKVYCREMIWVAVKKWFGLLCCCGWGSFLFNNSAWDWERGLQTKRFAVEK